MLQFQRILAVGLLFYAPSTFPLHAGAPQEPADDRHCLSSEDVRSVQASNRAARTMAPHMDHEAKHGGVFFMAPDQHHHLEGALEPSGVLRIYLYDAYTRPIVAKKFSAKARIQTSGRTHTVPFAYDRESGTLSTRLPSAASFPIDTTVWITFPARGREPRRTDLFSFSFESYSNARTP